MEKRSGSMNISVPPSLFAFRNHFLAPEAESLIEKVSEIADQLHGTCFYAGEDSPHFDTVLKKRSGRSSN
jgi:hypothetical protein